MRPRIPASIPGLLLLALLVPSGCDTARETETERMNAWFEVKFEEELQMSPVRLTRLGRKDRYDRIDDMSEAEMDRRLEWRARTVAELEAEFDYDLLDAQGRISYDIWTYQYEMERAEVEFRRNQYIFHQMMGAHAQLPQFLLNFHRVDDASDMAAYIVRIEGVGRAIRQLLERARLHAAEGIRPPRFAYETVIAESRALLTGHPFTGEGGDAPLWSDAAGKIDALLESGSIDETAAATFREDTRRALVEHFQPAFEEVIAWIESDIEHTTVNPTGVSTHANGDAYYRHMLRRSTSTDLDAEAIHSIGLSEVERLTEEMRAVMERTGFEGSLREFFDFVRTDERFFYPDTDEGRQGYIDDSRRFLDLIDERLPDYFGILPRAGLEVRRVEAFREQAGAPQHYSSGTPDGSRPGIYYAHLSDMRTMPKSEMEAIAYHEGNPGHHMQISIAQELESVPQFRTQAGFTVYVEGWALYAEKLAKEMGAYEDPYSEFGRLISEIWRAIRLVVDTGLHAKGWTEEDAVRYFIEHSPAPEGTVRTEVRRYIVWPGQATSYKIGMMRIEELRAHAEAELGDDFDIRAFHDTVLGGGAMPLHILERQVNEWIASVR